MPARRASMLIGSMAALALAGPAMAGPSPPGAAPAAPVCVSNADFLVVELPHEDAVGSSFIIRDAKAEPKPACSTAPTPGDVVIGGKDDPYSLLKLAGRYLLLDSGTGPDRSLIIRDLTSGTALFEGGYSDADIAIDTERATFWAASRAKASAANCRDLATITRDGLTPVIETLTTFDFASGELTGSEATRCIAHQ